jgi:hypothetical protein
VDNDDLQRLWHSLTQHPAYRDMEAWVTAKAQTALDGLTDVAPTDTARIAALQAEYRLCLEIAGYAKRKLAEAVNDAKKEEDQ